MKSCCIFLLLVLLSAACSEKSDEQTTQRDALKIRDIGVLSTTEYTIGKVLDLKDNSEWYKYGDRDILISCKAKIKAGIDLSQVKASDIRIEKDQINITLPEAKIVSFDMDPNFIKTEMESVNGLRASFTQDEKNTILKIGEDSIRKKINETNILHLAQQQADVFIRNFYGELGYKNIRITFKKQSEGESKSKH